MPQAIDHFRKGSAGTNQHGKAGTEPSQHQPSSQHFEQVDRWRHPTDEHEEKRQYDERSAGAANLQERSRQYDVDDLDLTMKQQLLVLIDGAARAERGVTPHENR